MSSNTSSEDEEIAPVKKTRKRPSRLSNMKMDRVGDLNSDSASHSSDQADTELSPKPRKGRRIRQPIKAKATKKAKGTKGRPRTRKKQEEEADSASEHDGAAAADIDPTASEEEKPQRTVRGSRSSPRKLAKIKTKTEPVITSEGGDDVVDPSEDKSSEEEQPPRRTTRAARTRKAKTTGKRTARRRLKQEKDHDSESEEESDFDPYGSDGQRPRRKSRGARTTPEVNVNNTSAGRGPAEERTCPHCKKVVCSREALKYHIDHFVCRIDECPSPELVDKAKRKRGKGKGSAVGKRFRGSADARTCPHCKRVFTSALGMNYHKKHKVCEQPAASKTQNMPPFHTLQAGETFVTSFGVVEVLKDERGTPTATHPENVKMMVRSWQSSKAKLEAQMSRALISKVMTLRVRRTKVKALFENGNLCQASMFHAYYGGDPAVMNTGERVVARRPAPDPMAPKDSFPDRLVHCILIPDKRKRYVGSDHKTPVNIQEQDYELNHTTSLFLKRRLLIERYNEDCPTYACFDCGQRFTSVSGLRYHISGKVCTQKNKAAGQCRKERETKVNEGTKNLLAGKVVQMYAVPRPRTAASKDTRKGRKRIRKKKELGMYPEVLISLGFKLVKEDMKFTDDMKLPEPIELKKEMDEEADEVVLQGDLTVDPPDALLLHLKKELVATQRRADDQKYGCMYAEVFKALKYRKPRKKRNSNDNENDISTSKRRRRATKLKPPPPPKPLPPIIDTRALADEVDSGRYPSMQRYKGEEHLDICFICQDGGALVCCDFCERAEHMKCIRKKFTVKDPEPEDDFMCHRCIQTILARRARAEKRRLEKQERDELRNQQEEMEESQQNPDIKKGMEYEYLAARGQETSEMVELLQDAQVRLRQSLATTRMNNVRRRIMGCFNTEK